METLHTFSYDETPTPTRFIRNCEEVGLFQDLQHNPFDETFRIAVETSSHDIPSLLKDPMQKAGSEETLNTPRISMRKEDSYQNVYSILDDADEDMILPDTYLIESILPEDPAVCSEKENRSNDSSDIEIVEEPIENDFISDLKSSSSSAGNVSTLTTSICQNNIIYTVNGNSLKNRIGGFLLQNTSVSPSNSAETSVNSNRQFVIQRSISNTKDKKEDKPMTTFNTTSVLKTVTTAKASDFLYQLSGTKLPAVLSGKNVVILPSRNTVSKTAEPRNVKVVSKSEPAVKQSSEIDVKQKLKNLLKSSASQIILDTNLNDEDTFQQSRESSGSSAVDHEKREYSRERNRMAQKRCRMKKKRWIMQLKRETECVLSENQNLQVEVSSLRAEIAHLKTLLLAHRNCSVTRAMFKADLSAIMGDDISQIAEDIEIPVPDSTDDSERSPVASYRSVSNVVSHHHQVNNQVNHIHVHVPPSPQPEEANKKLVQPLSLPRQIKLFNAKSKNQNKKLIFDSKVVPIKPDDRSANLLAAAPAARSNVLTMRNVRDAESGRRPAAAVGLKMVVDSQRQSSIVSGNISVEETIVLN